MYLTILKRCGWTLIFIGLVDVGFMVWCIAHQRSYNSSLNIFAVIAGVLLVRGGLKTAKWTTRLLLFGFSATVVGLLAVPFLLPFPLGYYAACVRQGGARFAVSMAVTLGVAAALAWVLVQLDRPEVRDAQNARAIAPPRKITPIVLGAALAVLICGLLGHFLDGASAHEALRRAQLRVGPNYRCVVTHLQIFTSGTNRATDAIVAAYNGSDLKTLRVTWYETAR